MAKIITSIVWLTCIACFFLSGSAWWITAGKALFWILLLAHAVELVIYWPTLKGLPGSRANHIIQVLLFGVLYWREVKPQH